MNARRWRITFVLVTLALGCGALLVVSLWFSAPPSDLPTPTSTPSFAFDDVWVVAVVATYEAQVFPEPLRSQAYAAIAWTMRNRVELGFAGTVSYTDERVLSRYASYQDHKDDLPDPRALDIARQVLTSARGDDPTDGARHYVDNSYWTGTHDQTGAVVKVRGKLSDADIRRLVDDNKFTLAIEWRTPPDHPKGLLFYALYFFDDWPPPMPVVTPTFTPTPRPTATVTQTPTATRKPTTTPTLTATLRITVTRTVTITPTLTSANQPVK